LKPAVTDFLTDFVALIYPRYCLACKAGLAKGEEIICTHCIHHLPKSDFHLYRKNPVFVRINGRIPLAFAFSFLLFKKGGIVQTLLHELKYNNRPEVGRVLGRVYGNELYNTGYSSQFDLILPVPLHAWKKKRRGYNQSEEFARGLADSMNVRFSSVGVDRLVNTETQTSKSKLKRWQNVSEVFRVTDSELVRSRRVLLVDDVITTGATLEACGKAILEAGSSSISVASIAYTAE
jgi:ComF family protein